MSAVRVARSGLRVLMTADAVGGVFSYATTLARAQSEAGATVTLVLQGPLASKDKMAQLEAIVGLTVRVTDLELEWRDPESRDAARAVRELERIAAEVEPDIVHINGFRDASADYRAPVVVASHSCVGSWWRACRDGKPDATWDGYTRDVRAGLNAADAWIAPSVAFRDAMQALYAPREPGHVVHNGISLIAQGPNDQSIVLAAGRMWDEAKDVATTVKAARHIRWPVRVAGPTAGNLDEHGDVTTFLGELPHAHLLNHMRKASIFVSSAVYEPFGLSVLEAAASGCALVLADIPSFRELWDGAALFFTPRDSRGLAQQVNALADDAMLRADLRRRATERARRYTADRTLAGTLAVYDALLHRPKQRARTAEAVSA